MVADSKLRSLIGDIYSIRFSADLLLLNRSVADYFWGIWWVRLSAQLSENMGRIGEHDPDASLYSKTFITVS